MQRETGIRPLVSRCDGDGQCSDRDKRIGKTVLIEAVIRIHSQSPPDYTIPYSHSILTY